MSLDLNPTLETTRDLSQTSSSSQSSPDPIETLSQRSGIPTDTLKTLTPELLNGLTRLEDDVTRAMETPGRMTPEALRTVTEVRDQFRAGITRLADASAVIESRPGRTQPAVNAPTMPPDASLQIRDNTITIGSDVYLYGSGATPEVAATFERQIREEWGQNPETGKPWTYTDPETGQTYDVKFDVNVKIYDPEHPERTPEVRPGETPDLRDNFIEVTSENGRSYVRGGNEGQWRADGRSGRSLEEDNPAAHEFGHILGLPDRYVEGGGAQTGWSGNMMAMPAGKGRVQQRDIDAVVRSHVEDYVKDGSPDTFTSPITKPERPTAPTESRTPDDTLAETSPSGIYQ